MTTNLEWLYENDREALIIMLQRDCDNCRFNSFATYEGCHCDRKWLEAEYVKPDSWAQVTDDADLGADNYCFDVLGWDDWALIHTDYNMRSRLVAKDIVSRCKKLARAE